MTRYGDYGGETFKNNEREETFEGHNANVKENYSKSNSGVKEALVGQNYEFSKVGYGKGADKRSSKSFQDSIQVQTKSNEGENENYGLDLQQNNRVDKIGSLDQNVTATSQAAKFQTNTNEFYGSESTENYNGENMTKTNNKTILREDF